MKLFYKKQVCLTARVFYVLRKLDNNYSVYNIFNCNSKWFCLCKFLSFRCVVAVISVLPWRGAAPMEDWLPTSWGQVLPSSSSVTVSWTFWALNMVANASSWNIGNQLSTDTAPHPRRTDNSTLLFLFPFPGTRADEGLGASLTVTFETALQELHFLSDTPWLF